MLKNEINLCTCPQKGAMNKAKQYFSIFLFRKALPTVIARLRRVCVCDFRPMLTANKNYCKTKRGIVSILRKKRPYSHKKGGYVL